MAKYLPVSSLNLTTNDVVYVGRRHIRHRIVGISGDGLHVSVLRESKEHPGIKHTLSEIVPTETCWTLDPAKARPA